MQLTESRVVRCTFDARRTCSALYPEVLDYAGAADTGYED